MRESVPTARYSPVCNVLRQWKTSLILTYRVYRLYDYAGLLLISLLLHALISMQLCSIDQPLSFDVTSIQLSFHTSVFTFKGVFNPNVTTFQLSQIAVRVCTLVLFIKNRKL